MFTSRRIFVDCVGLDPGVRRHPVPFQMPSGVTWPLLPGSRDLARDPSEMKRPR